MMYIPAVVERVGLEPDSAAMRRVLFAPRSVEDSGAKRSKSWVRYLTLCRRFAETLAEGEELETNILSQDFARLSRSSILYAYL